MSETQKDKSRSSVTNLVINQERYGELIDKKHDEMSEFK